MAIVVNEKEAQEEKTESQPSRAKTLEFLKEVREEFLKITWPSREQVTREFLSVILLVAVITGAIFIIDKLFESIFNFFSGRF